MIKKNCTPFDNKCIGNSKRWKNVEFPRENLSDKFSGKRIKLAQLQTLIALENWRKEELTLQFFPPTEM